MKNIIISISIIIYFFSLGLPLTFFLNRETPRLKTLNDRKRIEQKKIKNTFPVINSLEKEMKGIYKVISAGKKRRTSEPPLSRFYNLSQQAGVEVLSMEPARSGVNRYHFELETNFQAGISLIQQMQEEGMMNILSWNIITRPRMRFIITAQFTGKPHPASGTWG